MIKKILFLAVCAVVIFSAYSAAQTPSTPTQPYRNLEMWFATQSAPEAFQKAQWALDDINAYRKEAGLAELPEAIITSTRVAYREAAQPRRPLLRFRR